MSDTLTGDGDVTGVVEDMLRSEAVARSGQPYSAEALLGDDAPSPPEPQEAPSFQDLGLTALVPDNGAWIRALPAQQVDPNFLARPGLTQRGWSPEVTARHPQLLAETMAELAGDDPSAAEGIDPTDPEALARAQSALANNQVYKNRLRNDAIKLNYLRLTRGLVDAGMTSPAVQAAFAEAVEEAKAVASTGTDAAGGATESTTEPAPARTTTTRTRASTATTEPATPTSS